MILNGIGAIRFSMELVKYTIKSWFITKREILSLRVFKNTHLALSSYFTNYGNLKHTGKNPQFLRKLKCFKKLTKIFFKSINEACRHCHMASINYV